MFHNVNTLSQVWLFLSISISLFSLSCAAYISMSIVPSNLQINQVSSYSFILNRQFDPVNNQFTVSPAAVPLNSRINIVFPSQFQTISSTTAVPCTNSVGTDLGCTLNAATRTITVVNYYSSSGQLADPTISITMPSIVNAYKSGTTDNFYYSITQPGGSIIDEGPPVSSNYFSTALTFTGGTFTSCITSANGSYVSTSAALTFTLTPKNTIPANGRLVIGIPTSWASDPLLQSTITTTPTCTEISGIGSTSLACSYSSSQAQLTLTGFTNSVSGTFSFQVNTVLTPPTVGSGQAISIYSEWADSTSIDSCTTTVQGLVAAPFQAISLASNNNQTVQSSFSATLQLTLSRPFYYTDTIIFILPTEFLSVSVSSVNFNTMTRTPNLDKLTLSNFPSIPSTITSNNVITFTLTNLVNPMSAAPLTLNVTFYRSNQLYMTSPVTYTASTATISSFDIAPASNFVQTIGSATITLISSISFPASSTIIITYPTSVSATNVATTTVFRCSLNGTIKTGVTYNTTDNQLIFNNVFSTNFKGTVVIQINDLNNPPTTQPSNYLLTVNDVAGYGVMTGSYSLQADSRTLISNTVQASSLTALQTGVTYTVNITTNYAFTAISILIPSAITTNTGYQTTCAPNTFSSCTLNNRNLTFIGTLPAGTYSLSWGYNTNPSSLQPTDSFTINTYHLGWSVQKSVGVLSVTMNTLASFKTFVVYPSNYNNSATIAVSMTLTAPANTPAGVLTVTLPSQLGLSSAICSSNCTIVPPNILINLASGTTSSTTLTNVNNVPSFKPVSAFTSVLNDTSGYGSVSGSTSGWTNTNPSSFVTTVSGNNNYKGEDNNFQFQMSGLGGQSYIKLSINTAFSALTSAPSGTTLIDSYTISYPCNQTSCSLPLTLTNPTISNNYTFSLSSFTSDNYQVGTSTSNLWTFACPNSNCRSCQNNTCLSCYNSSISIYDILNVTGGSCVSACTQGYFLVGTVCTQCDSNCSQCSGNSTRCTVCPTNFYLDTTYYLCVPQCLNGQFKNQLNKQCDPCTAPCRNCIITAITCLSCNSSTYLHNQQCLFSCPNGTHIANAATSNCDPCNSNCLTCSNSTTTCTSCNNTNNLYLEVNICVANCSNNYYLVNLVCTFCQLPCRTCSTTVNTCASCYLNSSYPIYYAQTCIGSSLCPVGHYVNSTNSSCQPCSSQCTTCSSLTSCSVCNSSYYLYGSSCLSSCPNVTYNYTNTTSGYCLSCSPCLTCSAVNICTSCSSSMYLYLNTCYSICPNSTYPSGNVCLSCPVDCPTCQNTSFCTSCVTTLLLYQGVCYSTCPNSTYASGTVCVVCPAECRLCTSASVCQSCATNYSLENSQCTRVCSVGVSYNQICYPCGLNCGICSNSTGVCSLCTAPYLLYNNTCVMSCPTNMLTQDNQTCILCSNQFVNCTTCNSTQCLSCNYGQLKLGECVPCDPGSYAQSGACVPCPVACATCTSQTVCQSCAANHYMYNSACTGQCPRNMVPNGTTCSLCTPFCAICSRSTSLCTTCQGGVYLYNNLCYSQCPAPLVISYDFLSCVTEEVYYQQFSQAAKIIPFPFTIAAVGIIILGYILKCFHKDMHLITALCAVVALVEFASWIIFVGFSYMYYQNYHETAFMGFICGIVALALLYGLNFLHLRFYFKYIVSDEQFSKWHRNNGCINCLLITLATLLTFKLYRLIHSKFLSRPQLSLVLSSVSKLVPFSMLGILSLLLCSAPILVGCALALYNSVSRDQQFFIALDTIVVTAIMVLLILMDLRHPDQYFHDQHEAHNLKRKIYEEDSIKFEKLQQGSSENSAAEGGIQEEQLVMASTGQKFRSTFHQSKQLQADQGSLTKIKGQQQLQQEQQFGYESSQGDNAVPVKAKWQPVKYDHHGYLLKYDANNDPIRYDQNGYRVQIDQEGNHHLYNEDGHEMKLVNGKYEAHDQEGLIVRNGKRYDQRGYQVREVNEERVYYDKHGFRVIGGPPNEKHIDADGNEVKQDQEGNLRRYNDKGYEVVQYKGKKTFKDSQGRYMRLNDQGEWQRYNPETGYTLKEDPQTGEWQEFDEYGFRVVKDKYGNLVRFDQDGFKVTILPGAVFVRHDQEGYRVEKDEEGNIHRYDQEGYELVRDQNGVPRFIDKHGYTVIRDLNGVITLYTADGLRVIIDPETGIHHKYNEQGLQVTKDAEGNIVLMDKRGNIVKELEDGQTYEKYDKEGNKVFLDERGYEVDYDQEGQAVFYDKVGDRVEQDYDIEQSQDGVVLGQLMPNRKMKYRYKQTQAINNEHQLEQMIAAQQAFTFEQPSQMSDLPDMYDNEPVLMSNGQVDHQLEKMMIHERSSLKVDTQGKDPMPDLVEPQAPEDQYHGTEGLEGLKTGNQRFKGSKILANREGGQAEYDKQAIARGIDQSEPDILAVKKEQDRVAAQARRRDLNRILNAPRGQDPIQIKSVADMALDQRSFENEGVQPMQNRTDNNDMQLDQIDDLPLNRVSNRRGGGSQYLPSGGKKNAKTVYNFNTVQVQIKNNPNLYDEQQQIQSLQQQQWHQQQPVFMRERLKEGSSNANTNVVYLQQDEDNKDTLSDFVQHQSEHRGTKQKRPLGRYQMNNQILSGRSIQQIQQQLFGQAGEHGARQRKQFKLSGAPNPLVQYAKAIQNNKKSLQQKMYLDSMYKR